MAQCFADCECEAMDKCVLSKPQSFEALNGESFPASDDQKMLKIPEMT